MSDITSRLTDPAKYTGMYANKQREGISQAAKEGAGSNHAKNFGEAPVQKFGLQTAKPKKFTCWNGVDKWATGQTILCANITKFEQLVAKCAASCSVNPVPVHLHTAQGKVVSSLDDIADGEDFLCIQKGATYKRDKLPTALKTKVGL